MATFRTTERKHPQLPSVAEVAAAIRRPTDQWAGKCDHVVQEALAAGLFPGGKDRYGQYLGPIDPNSLFAQSPTRQHAWIEMPRRIVVDLTRWVFEAWEPYVATITPRDRRHRQYDVGGLRLGRAQDRALPPGPDAPFGRSAAPQPCALHVTHPTAVRLIEVYFGCTPDRLTVAQVFWLANLSSVELGKAARPIFQAIQNAGNAGLVPYDSWRAVME